MSEVRCKSSGKYCEKSKPTASEREGVSVGDAIRMRRLHGSYSGGQAVLT